MIIPDKEWYKNQSKIHNGKLLCPYANSYKCPRYYESVVLLSRVNMISGLPDKKKDELETFWERTNFSALCDEEVPSISRNEYNQLRGISNFCPEIAFRYLEYYASFMYKYVDEIDQDFGCQRAKKDNLNNDWRYVWARVNAVYYMDCEIYERVVEFNKELGSNYLIRLHPNIVLLVSRMDSCLDNNDWAGAIHAAGNILETMAKEIVNNPKVANETLGGFIAQFEKISNLPDEIKGAVLAIYKLRNTNPTSSHGSLEESQISQIDAIAIAVMTKAILEIEYRAKNI
ncbi:hypothetical protein OAP63_06300 [Vibrio sp.]|nr:hypothetical protein [Vibrio sp.]